MENTKNVEPAGNPSIGQVGGASQGGMMTLVFYKSTPTSFEPWLSASLSPGKAACWDAARSYGENLDLWMARVVKGMRADGEENLRAMTDALRHSPIPDLAVLWSSDDQPLAKWQRPTA